MNISFLSNRIRNISVQTVINASIPTNCIQNSWTPVSRILTKYIEAVIPNIHKPDSQGTAVEKYSAEMVNNLYP